jgi:maltose alpha-D-glucosyltransferase/alpha-amylase
MPGLVPGIHVPPYHRQDMDGRDIGEGLLRRLDYLQGLGVTAIWLMPFQPSPGLSTRADDRTFIAAQIQYALDLLALSVEER